MAARGQEQAKKAKEQGPGWGGGGLGMGFIRRVSVLAFSRLPASPS